MINGNRFRQFYRLEFQPPIPAKVLIRRIGNRTSTSEYQARIHNLSGRGCRLDLKVDLPIRDGVIVDVHFHFRGRDYALPAEIRWKLDDRKLDRIHYGVEFTEIREYIQSALIKGLHETQIERRLQQPRPQRPDEDSAP